MINGNEISLSKENFIENELLYNFLKMILWQSSQLHPQLNPTNLFLLYQFIRSKYENTEVVFVSHDTAAYEVNEEQFFTRGNSGGTLVSAGLDKVINIIEKRFHPSSWNIYTFQCSDGDNWPDDTDCCLRALERIKQLCQLVGYCEIEPDGERSWKSDHRLSVVYKGFLDSKFKMASVISIGGRIIPPVAVSLTSGSKAFSFWIIVSNCRLEK